MPIVDCIVCGRRIDAFRAGNRVHGGYMCASCYRELCYKQMEDVPWAEDVSDETEDVQWAEEVPDASCTDTAEDSINLGAIPPTDDGTRVLWAIQRAPSVARMVCGALAILLAFFGFCVYSIGGFIAMWTWLGLVWAIVMTVLIIGFPLDAVALIVVGWWKLLLGCGISIGLGMAMLFVAEGEPAPGTRDLADAPAATKMRGRDRKRPASGQIRLILIGWVRDHPYHVLGSLLVAFALFYLLGFVLFGPKMIRYRTASQSGYLARENLAIRFFVGLDQAKYFVLLAFGVLTAIVTLARRDKSGNDTQKKA